MAEMKAWELLGEHRMPDGSAMRLLRQDREYVISVDGRTLMSSRMHGSEEALASAACRHLRHVDQPRVLVGGLGMGFTLAATLAELPADAVITLVELVPAVVGWNRGPLGSCAGYPLNDRRVRVVLDDVGFVLRGHSNTFDAILLDVDNGPSAFTTPENESLYDTGIVASYTALRAGGVLAVWSAWEDTTFEQHLRHHGFRATAERVRARPGKRGAKHTIFVGVKDAPRAQSPRGSG